MRKLIALSIVAGMAPFAFADGNTASAEAQSSVTIICPISITKTADLCFGTFVSGGGGGIVTLNCDGTLNAALTGNIWKFTGAGNPASPAKFEVMGEKGYPFHFSAPLDVDLMHKNGGKQTLRVICGTYANLDDTLPTTVAVGGILTLIAPQPGTYTGSFNATVNYL